jgi:single-stranded DNA-binding protein
MVERSRSGEGRTCSSPEGVASAAHRGVNVVVLAGRLSRPAEQRQLPSGSRLSSFEVTVPRAGSRADTVPVVAFDAPPRAATLDAGEGVVVVGRVRRRFFRGKAAVTLSRTEVEAWSVVPAARRAGARGALLKAASAIEDAALEGGI